VDGISLIGDVPVFGVLWAVTPAALLLMAAAHLAPSEGRSALLFAVPATILAVLWGAFLALDAVSGWYGIGSLLGETAAALATIATVAVWRARQRAQRTSSTVSKGGA
jgi:hypothetical protein